MTTNNTSKRFNDVAGFTLLFPQWNTTTELPSSCLPGWFFRMTRQDDGSLDVFLVEQDRGHGADYETGLRLWTIPLVDTPANPWRADHNQQTSAEHKVAALEFCLRGAVGEAVTTATMKLAKEMNCTIEQQHDKIQDLTDQVAQRNQQEANLGTTLECFQSIADYTTTLLDQQDRHAGTALTKDTLRGLLAHLKNLQDESVKASVQRLAGQEETPVTEPAPQPSTTVVIPDQVFTRKISVIKAVMDATDRRYGLRDTKQEIVEGALPFAVRADRWDKFIRAMDDAGAIVMIMVDGSGKQYGPVHANDDIEAMKEQIRAALTCGSVTETPPPTETPENFVWARVCRNPLAVRDKVRVIQAIKLIREFGGLSLKEAKDAWDLDQWFRIKADQAEAMRVQVVGSYGLLWDSRESNLEPVNHAPVHYPFGTTGF